MSFFFKHIEAAAIHFKEKPDFLKTANELKKQNIEILDIQSKEFDQEIESVFKSIGKCHNLPQSLKGVMAFSAFAPFRAWGNKSRKSESNLKNNHIGDNDNLGLLTYIFGFIGLSTIAFLIYHLSNQVDVQLGNWNEHPLLAYVPVVFVFVILFAAIGLFLSFMIKSHLKPGQKNKSYLKEGFVIIVSKESSKLLDAELDIEECSYVKQRQAILPVKTNFILLLILSLGLFSCKTQTQEEKKIMFNTPGESVEYFEPETKYQIPNTKAGYDSAKMITSPLLASKEVLAKGQELFESYCKHCHGLRGQSDAPMIEKEKYPPPPKFSERLPEITEGQMFHSIYYGKNLMPGNQNDLTEEEIWWLVGYIKTLKHENE